MAVIFSPMDLMACGSFCMCSYNIVIQSVLVYCHLLLYFDLNSIATVDSMLIELLFDLFPAFQHVLAVRIVCLALHVYRHITKVY